jgi:hypothetical protein
MARQRSLMAKLASQSDTAKLRKAMLLFIASLSLGACVHVGARPTAPPTFGFHGIVSPGRDVACVIDADMTAARCDDVARAVDKIDSAVGYELLAAPRHITMAEVKALKPRDEVIVVGVDSLTDLHDFGGVVLGVTRASEYHKDTGVMCLQLIVYSPEIWLDDAMMQSVVLHELLHAVGAEHAAQPGAFLSVEMPAWRPGAPTELTPGDISALRAAYPR